MNSVPNIQKSISRWSVGYGIIVIILGMIAIASPDVVALSVNVMIALLLIIAGVTKTLFAFKAGSFGKGALQFLFGGLTVIYGIAFIAFPMFGLASLTLLLISYFLFDGGFTIVAAFRMKPMKGWGFMLINGIATILLGIIIANNWPESGELAIGLLVGIRLLMSGFAMLMLGVAVAK
jgi:uncharacterized membrane protein HdeD (DUF308 family)